MSAARVHVVCDLQATGKERILGRLALSLRELGWSLGPSRGRAVDWNYFFPYLWWKAGVSGYEPEGERQDAAWFTHDEGASRPDKARQWQQAAEAVALRLASAELYRDRLAAFGEARLVVPPLDRQKFQPQRKAAGAGPAIVGTSGFVYPGARKGEDLWFRLQQEPRFAGRARFLASGRGWFGECLWQDWRHMEDFYHLLDLYVCTSRLEGIGYGPMEALACGLPCVVPRGVGLFDELGEAEGLERYEAGDQDSLAAALERALASRGRAEELRALTERFTPEAWLQSHEEAFAVRAREPGEEPEAQPPAAARPSFEPGKRGAYIVAYGEAARRCAEDCLRSLRRWAPALETCLVSSAPLGLETHFRQEPEVDIGARAAKIRIDQLAPEAWEHILYLDADTELLASPEPAFAALAAGWQFLMVPNPAQYHLASNMKRPDNKEEVGETCGLFGTGEFLQYNGGVFAYRRCAETRRFFALWLEEWRRWAKRDQAAFDRALWQQPLLLWTLGKEWNLVDRYDRPSPGRTVVLHHPTRARRTTGIVYARGDSPEAWAAVGGKK